MSEDELVDVELQEHGGLFATHKMPCGICHERPAVFDCQKRFFNPCWTCQGLGFQIRKKWAPGIWRKP